MADLTRRKFLALGAAAATAMVLDPERLLWVPGARTFYLPPEKRVVAAAIGDVEAVALGLGGPMFVGYDHARRTVAWGMPSSHEIVLSELSDQEYALVLDRGRRMLRARGEIIAPPVPAAGWR
jgi:hypothetical protein